MKVEEVKITAIKPYEKNPRKNDRAIDPVAESIRQFGFKQPIVIDKDGVIVAGHTRYKAAQKLGMDTVPCVRADDLTPAQVKAYRIADNKLNEMATWDFVALNDELATFDFDFEPFQFELPNLDLDGVIEKAQTNAATGANTAAVASTGAASISGSGAGVDAATGGYETFCGGAESGEQAEELQGVNLAPPDIPALKGEELTLRERVIIVYKKEDAARVAALLGVDEITKVIYTLEEIDETD